MILVDGKVTDGSSSSRSRNVLMELVSFFTILTALSSAFKLTEARETNSPLFIDRLINGSSSAAAESLNAARSSANSGFNKTTLVGAQNSLEQMSRQQVVLSSRGVSAAPSRKRHQQRPQGESSVVRRSSAGLSVFRSQPQSQSQQTQLQQQQQRPQRPGGYNLSLALVRQRWRQMERSLGDSLGSLGSQLRLTLDELSKQTGGGASGACKLALAELLDGLGQQKLWASLTVDASAKLPSGLLEGTLTELGNYDQCLAIRYPIDTVQDGGQQQQHSTGQYCSLQIKPPLMPRPRLHTVCQPLPALSQSATEAAMVAANQSGPVAFRLLSQNSHQFYYVGLRLGVCTPSQCARSDLQQLLTAYLAKYELLGQVKSCQVAPNEQEPQLDVVQQCIASTFVALLVLITLGTLLDSSSSSKLARSGSLVCKTMGVVYFGSSANNPNEQNHEQLLQQQHVGHVRAAQAAKIGRREPSIEGKRWSQFHIYQAACELKAAAELPVAGQLQRNPLVELAALASAGQRKDSETSGLLLAGDKAAGGGDDEDEVGPEEEAWITQLEANQREESVASNSVNRQPHLNGAEMDSTPATSRGERREEAKSTFGTVIRSLLVCFSIKRNLANVGRHSRSRLATEVSSRRRGDGMDDIKVIHGLRTITMVWIIFGHTIGLVSPEMMNNLFALAQLSCSSRLLQAILNATLAVNTFFMISGLVTVISLVRKCKSAQRLLVPAKSRKANINCSSSTGSSNISEPELWSMDSSSIVSSLSSTASSNKCINSMANGGRRHQHQQRQQVTGNGKFKSAKGQLGNKMQANSINGSRANFAIRRRQQLRQQQQQQRQQLASSGWPGDFKPLLWLMMRYLRLTPAYAAIIGFSILMPALGSGPFWQESAGSLGPACRRNWWLNLLYVNNFIETDKLCLIHSWYLSNDWQFFIIGLLLFGIFYKSRKLACLLMVILFLASTALTFTITVTNELPPTIVTTSPAVAERWLFIHSLYYKPWPHLPSYLIGLLAGYLILIKEQLRLSSRWRLLCWLLFSLVALSLLNSIYPWNMGLQVDPIITGLHSAAFRTLWSACCAWLVFALATEPENPLAHLLSWHGFQVTSRLTYCAYLVHPLIIYYHFGTLRERIDSSPYGQLHRFMATLGLSYLFALLLTLLAEGPSIELQRLLISLSSSKGNFDNGQGGCSRRQHELELELDGTKSRKGAHEGSTVHSWTASSSFGERNSLLAGSPVGASPCSFKVTSTLAGGSGGQFANQHSAELARILSGSASNKHQQALAKATAAAAAFASASVSASASFAGSAPGGEFVTPGGLVAPAQVALTATTIEKLQRQQQQQQRELALLGAAEAGGEGAPAAASPPALDAEFQRKLAQAISRGFRIRTRIANGTLRQQQQQMMMMMNNEGALRRATQVKRLPNQPGAVDQQRLHQNQHQNSVVGNAALVLAEHAAHNSNNVTDNNQHHFVQANETTDGGLIAGRLTASDSSLSRFAANQQQRPGGDGAGRQRTVSGAGEFSTFVAATVAAAGGSARKERQTTTNGANATVEATGRRRQSHDLTPNGGASRERAHQLEQQHQHSKQLAQQTANASANGHLSSATTNLNELILMKQKLLSQSQSQTDVKQRR